MAIAIPVFTTQLERSREATDLSNIRAAYAEAVSDYLASGATTAKTATVTGIKQTVNGWTIEDPNLYTRVNGTQTAVPLPAIDKTTNSSVTVTVAADGSVSVTAS